MWSARVVVLGGGVRSVVGFDWWWVSISGGFLSFLSDGEDDQTTTKTEDRWWRLGREVHCSPLLSFLCDEKNVRGEKKVRQKKKIQKKITLAHSLTRVSITPLKIGHTNPILRIDNLPFLFFSFN